MRVLRIVLLVLALELAAAQASARITAPPPNVNVSNLPGPQTNATIAVDPNNPKVLLAGSNSVLEGTQRIYSSLDGGSTWHSSITIPPAADLASACPSDPGVGDRPHRPPVLLLRRCHAVQRAGLVARLRAHAPECDRGLVGPDPRRPPRPGPLRRQAGDRGRRVAVEPSPEPRLRRLDPRRPEHELDHRDQLTPTTAGATGRLRWPCPSGAATT